MTKKKETNIKAKKVLDVAFESDVNPIREMVAREEAIKAIMEIKNKEGNDSLQIQLKVEDVSNKHWLRKEHFTKIFDFEIKHLMEYYSLNRNEKHFLLDLSDFLMWQTNLLVDEEDNPINQKQIAERLDINVRTVQRNMKALEERKIIHKIQIWNKVYYIINPYVMFKGKDINISIPKLFDELGYLSSSIVNEKNNRSNRKKEQQKRITVG
jgi:predicted transcriptional regulator